MLLLGARVFFFRFDIETNHPPPPRALLLPCSRCTWCSLVVGVCHCYPSPLPLLLLLLLPPLLLQS